jgi:mono/diheme cytochrome c family protein
VSWPRANSAIARAVGLAIGTALFASSIASAQSAAATATPALYSDAQAQKGVDAYETNCGMCHGANMEGAQGPTLLGQTLTSHYQTVGDLMQFIVQNMPMSDPGSLAHDDYVDILAFVLQKNGWPSGNQRLTFADASASKVPLTQGP